LLEHWTDEQIDYTDSTQKSQLTYRKKASEFLNQEIVPNIDPEEIINVPQIVESESPTGLSKWYDLTALEEQNQEINQWRSNSMCRQFDPLIQQNPSFSAPTQDEQSVALSVLAAETAERDLELEQTKSGSGKTYPTENIIRLSEDDAKKLLHEKSNVIQMLMERKFVLEKKIEYRSRKEGQLSQKTLKKGLELQQKQKQHLRAVKEYTRLRAILHQINHDIDSVMTTIENQQSKNQRLKPIITAMQSFETELVTKHQELAYKIEKKEQELLSRQEESLYEIDAVFHEYEERINSIEAKNSKIQFLIRRNELKVASLQDELEKRQAEKIQLYNLWDELMKGNAAE
jgi:hypothetical protein